MTYSRVYLGYSNKRAAVAFRGHQIVVLIDGKKSCVLQGIKAQDFLEEITNLSHHLCGVKHCSISEELVSRTDKDLGCYNAIFDEWFEANLKIITTG